MKKKLALAFVLTLLLSLLLTTSALAQTYLFSLDEEIVDVYWESDGTLSLEYEFVFTNSAFASPIDFVDVGLPNNNYSISNITASVDGHPILDIEDSPYVTYGVALGLGSNAIRSGQTGTVRMSITGIRNVLFQDSDDSAYASGVFSPTWFGSEFVEGSTDLTVIYHFPPGLTPEEPRWHRAPSGFPSEPATGFDADGRITYTWRNQVASGAQQYLFGASFPQNYVPASTIQTPTFWQRLGIDPDALFGFAIFCGVFLFIFAIPIVSLINNRRRKMQYLPPKVSIQGHGVKRGLTAVEAAILLEQPMDKVLTMILFGVLRKDAAQVTKQDPLELELEDPLPDDLREYEIDFLTAFEETSRAKRRRELQKMMVGLVKSVTRKMKGFSRKETSDYYKKIMERAWAQVEAADTPEVKSEKFNENMEWTMLDKEYDDRTRRTFRQGPVIIPGWWHRYDPVYAGPARTAGPSVSKPSAPSMRPTSGSLPTLPGSTFAASMINGVENVSAGVIGSLNDFTSGITRTTNPLPKPSTSTRSRSGGGGGGGSSCACACACAGCACACAGGGR
ncbi:MAG: hypothetical protein DWQ07_02280 [Chloroflexi bacterium]|nr:MAG: hypothetical protein DWQ07_02280 [Chloroflexota bacterium]MBL1193674.1 hypothetical protein [Chloroflexota bacterium]NOH10966.1 hypothetical protein [Chloroflexota bacterium]